MLINKYRISKSLDIHINFIHYFYSYSYDDSLRLFLKVVISDD